MSRRFDAIQIALDVQECPHKDECTGCGSLWGTIEDGREHKPSPHVGGKRIDEYCVYFLAQNPGNAVDHEKFDHDGIEFLQKHHEGLVEQFTPGDVLEVIGLKWDFVVWENMVRCPTVDNKMDGTLIGNCKHWTERQLEVLDPDVVVAMGAYSRDYFDSEFGAHEMWVDGTIFCCMPHYAYLMRNGSLQEVCKQVGSALVDQTPDYIWL